MAEDSGKWSLADLIDFETRLAGWEGRVDTRRSGKRGRAAVMRAWLESRGEGGAGARWVASLGLAGVLLALLAAIAGVGASWGTLDRELEGVHVLWFLGAALVLPWGLFLLGLMGWLFRGRVNRSGLVGWGIERLSLRIAGKRARQLVERVRRSGELAKVTAWRLARRSQWIAAAFHGGALAGLASMVLFKRVGFYWETTTERAMEGFLEQAVRAMALPWSSFAPWALPDVAGTRRGPEWDGGGESWWPFLLLSLLVWGLLPRALLAGFAGWRERRALATLTFQAPHHRRLWRALTEVRRGEEPEGPVDGALVIALDSAEPDREVLRPFLLRQLRMNPTGWESLGVLDAGREDAARRALARAPAGIVLFAEGWSLAPRQMENALREVMSRAGERRVVVLVDGADDDQRTAWGRFMDERSGDGVELVFHDGEEEA